MRILITGADGFVGRASAACCVRAGAEVVAAVRRRRGTAPGATVIEVGDVDSRTDWSRALAGVDAVIHTIAATHGRDAADPRAWPRYHALNVAATRALAEQCRMHGVKRFVFLSSIKVNGEATLAPAAAVRPFRAGDPPRPQDNYGRSKLEAELLLQAMAEPQKFEPVILRPPLIYGPGQKGNLLRLMQWIHTRRPLPFKSVDNRRSLLYVGNLADALYRAATRPGVGSAALPLADITLSIVELVQAMAAALGVRPRLVHCPALAFRMIALVPRGRALVERLCGSLTIDSSAAGAALDWTPQVSLAAALRETAAWFLERRV